MTRHPKNEAFAQTSFLQGANAAYIEEMQAQYERNPGSVSDEWRHFFASLNEERHALEADGHGPSWARPLEEIESAAGNRELIGALTGDWGGTERVIREKLQARAQAQGGSLDPVSSMRATQDSIRALMLIRAYRVMGHLAADLDPLGLAARKMHKELKPETYGFTEADLDRPIFIDKVLGLEIATVREILKILRRTYCRHIGIEFMHITSPVQKSWLQERIEGRDKDITFTVEGKRAILNKLVEAEAFEKFADVKYTGTKRFGLDGAESMVPALEQIIKRGGQLGVKEIVIGMAHRGRLNVLANVLSKPLRAIFNEFKGGSFKPDDVDGSGDVKYHLGASSDRAFDGNNVHLSLTANPSHLEIVDPVVLGKVRAKQDQHGCKPGERTPVLPLLIHGDAAFAGQGVVAECFGLSGLKGHRTGGSIHFIINNQIGFTTNPRYSRSSPYCSDVAKMVEAPIFHVNGDNPETVVHVAKIATEFRQRFQKPVVIDMFCYRRHGHNESDEPAFTQPLMYQAIKAHPSTVELYSKRLIEEGVVSDEDVAGMKARFRAHLDEELAASDSYKPNKADWLDGRWSEIGFADDEARRGQTGVAIDTLKEVGRRLTSIPQDFNAHRTIQRLLQRRREMIETGTGVDWAMAEHLAFGTLLNEGFPVRLSGQDSERGTFSQRHSVLFDQETERRYTPLKYVSPSQGRFEVINSMLSEEAVLAFEYGYTLAEPNALTMWEAQFGDFANGAQVVFDQFISSGERKWLRMSGLVCLLPHGYEGQGPEHSSARLERFLQLCAEDNWQVANCTTPANYFHILRRQLHRKFRKPLVLMTPKSLLRHKRVVSDLAEMGPGTTFHRVLWDDAQFRQGEKIALRPDKDIRRVVLCSGKVYYDLYEAREAAGIDDVYLMRVEQYYPFPARTLMAELGRFPKADVVWAQEEPKNMGAWSFMEPNLEWVLQHLDAAVKRPVYAGRPASAATATGLASRHNQEQGIMAIEIKVPALGESVTEATVGQWFKKPGDAVNVDEPIVELETDKVTVEVPAPSAGVLAAINVEQGATVAVGAVLGAIESAQGRAEPAAAPAASKPAKAAKPAAQAEAPQPKPAAPPPREARPAAARGEMPPAPAARKLMEEKGLSPEDVPGSGRRGQVLKEDVMAALARSSPAAAAPAEAVANYAPPSVPAPAPALRAPSVANDAAREERVRMTRLRQTIARRLKEAQNTAAMLTTFNDVDMSAIMKLRAEYKDQFEKRHHVKLGFMAFFVKACIQALREIPAVNAEIDGQDIIYKNYYHIGVAVGTDKGLVVPVVREADRLSFAEIEQAISDFGRRARDGKLSIEEMQGGTFTISNGGVYGSLLSTPILNAPQSGILGMHRIEERAVVRNGQIVARPIMNLALSYDHRIVDGREAVTFLVRVKECLEDPQRFLLEL